MQKLPIFLVLASTVAFSSAATAQDAALVEKALSMRPDPASPVGENFEVPLGWSVRLDRPDDAVTIGSSEESDIFFVSMTPGWHVTTGPRAIFYHPASTAEGRFRARAGIYLFPPGERNEAFGLFVGGKNLDTDNQEYLYFVVRRSGEFLVKKRMGEETEVIHPWTAHESILPYTQSTEGTVHNVLEIVADDDKVSFSVNEAEVASMPRDELDVDGIVGLRVNHALNLHVDDLSVEKLD